MKAVRVFAELQASEQVASGWQRLRFQARELSSRAQPGQFIMLGPLDEGSVDPFLNRPYSIHRRLEGGRLELLVARVGRGSEALSRAPLGSRIPMLGPLGRGFTWRQDQTQALLVAGGVGVAPMVFLAEVLLDEGKRVRLVLGAAGEEALLLVDGLQERGLGLSLCTDDGSAGLHGTAVDGAREWLARHQPGPDVLLAGCGPEPMLRALAELARGEGLDAQLSLENRMACGTGACMGCSLPMGTQALRVCVDGPVFQAREIWP